MPPAAASSSGSSARSMTDDEDKEDDEEDAAPFASNTTRFSEALKIMGANIKRRNTSKNFEQDKPQLSMNSIEIKNKSSTMVRTIFEIG
jgi:hypothetical protein